LCGSASRYQLFCQTCAHNETSDPFVIRYAARFGVRANLKKRVTRASVGLQLGRLRALFVVAVQLEHERRNALLKLRVDLAHVIEVRDRVALVLLRPVGLAVDPDQANRLHGGAGRCVAIDACARVAQSLKVLAQQSARVFAVAWLFAVSAQAVLCRVAARLIVDDR
jgi:hypothetical protein